MKSLFCLLLTSLCIFLAYGCSDTPRTSWASGISSQFESVHPPAPSPASGEHIDAEIRRMMEKGITMGERKQQVAAIYSVFSRHTSPDRARHLAALCFVKTLGSPFTPMDLAEIALAETGGHSLSGRAVSYKGAVGVWQLMPVRAKSYGYTPGEMASDDKCADAAIRELYGKLIIAQGNMDKAKKLYCGRGPQAEQYIQKVRRFRKEISEELDRIDGPVALNIRSASP